MKIEKVGMSFLIGGAAFVQGIRAQSQDRPNIVLIFVDDMGWSDLGCYGSEIETPHLDAMAREGILFTDFYNATRSCPSRASILTGLYPHQAGVGAMTGDDARTQTIPAYQGYLRKDCVTLGEVMGSNGYHTMFSGKWHVGDSCEEMLPHRRGFERSFMTPGGAGCFFRLGWLGRRSPYLLDGASRMPGPDFYDTDAVFDYTIQFIRGKTDDRPFFAFISPRAPHWPLHAKQQDIQKYFGRYDEGWDVIRERRHQRQIELGLIPPEWSSAPRGNGVPAWSALPEEKRRTMAAKMEVYAAQVDSLDQNVGKLIDFLKQEGLFDNTLILFLSDNGADSDYYGMPNNPFGRDWLDGKGGPVGSPGSFESYGRAWAEVSNTPFRLWKGMAHEGGVATPLIAFWPDGITVPGTVSRQPGHIIDVMATALDVSGGTYPGEFDGHAIQPLEGISFAPVFRGRQRREHDVIAWEHFAARGIRSGRWKLVAEPDGQWFNATPGRWELYDLKLDRTEIDNLAAKMPEKVRELSRLYDLWARRIGVVDSTADWRR